MTEQERATKQLRALKKEHQELDKQIKDISSAGTFDQIGMQRLKRRKLWLKDQISSLEGFLYDDIIA